MAAHWWSRQIGSLGLLACLEAGCGEPEARPPTGPRDGSAPEADAALAFPDSGLEAAVRAALGRTEGPLSAEEALSLRHLAAAGRGIADLAGLPALANLATLDLADNRIADLSPLAVLVQLESLSLANNRISDLAPLAALVRLRYLDLDHNQVRDLSALGRLAELRLVDLAHNQVEDVAPLLRLAALASVDLTGNPLGQVAMAVQAGALAARGVEVRLADGTDGSEAADPDLSLPADLSNLRLAFLSDRGGGNSLYVVKADGSDVVSLGVALSSSSEFAWSPDGRRLLYVQDQDIYIVGADGGGRRRLTDHPAVDNAAAWLPDGRRIVFFSNRDGRPGIYAMDADGRGVELLVELVGGRRDVRLYEAIAVTRDGTRLAFSSNLGGGFDIYVADVRGGHLSNVADTGGLDHAVSWSPDGTRISFVATPEASLYLVEDGGHRVRLAQRLASTAPAAWSARDGTIAFATLLPLPLRRSALWAARPGLAERDTLLVAPSAISSPTWSPDGARIAYSAAGNTSTNPGDSDIYVLDVDRRELVNVTRNPARDTCPVWSPR
ncbi:MAG: leucine-rich repeat domain-containing protein [Candidatus Latescibacterota bacterium]